MMHRRLLFLWAILAFPMVSANGGHVHQGAISANTSHVHHGAVSANGGHVHHGAFSANTSHVHHGAFSANASHVHHGFHPPPGIAGINAIADCKPAKKVLWFMAVQSYTKSQENKYYNFVFAAVNSARAFAPSLSPFLIHNGSDADVPEALRNVPNMRLVSHNLTFKANLTKALGERTMIGAWYRFDVPYIVKNILTDLNPDEYDLDYALYTDTDVLFFHDFNECSLPKPKVLYIGPEGRRGTQANSGVLYMNLTAMQEHWPSVMELANKKNFRFAAVDQGLFLDYFVKGGKYSTLLPDRFNWKAYWGSADDVVIAHFHGPKPGECLDCLILNRIDALTYCKCPSVYVKVYGMNNDGGSFYRSMLESFNNFTQGIE